MAVQPAPARVPEWFTFRAAVRLRAGRRVSNPAEEAAAWLWLSWLEAEDLVVGFTEEDGFRYWPRRPGIDLGIVRRLDPEPAPCVRVVSLESGAIGCSWHGLTIAGKTRIPLGCQLVPALVCNICHRVAHVQLRGPFIAYSPSCLRCRTAVRELPRWATWPPRRSRERRSRERRRPRDGEVNTSLRVAMAAWFGDGTTSTACAPGSVGAPERTLPWREWTDRYPATAEASAHSAVQQITAQLPDGLREAGLGVDVGVIAAKVRWKSEMS